MARPAVVAQTGGPAALPFSAEEPIAGAAGSEGGMTCSVESPGAGALAAAGGGTAQITSHAPHRRGFAGPRAGPASFAAQYGQASNGDAHLSPQEPSACFVQQAPAAFGSPSGAIRHWQQGQSACGMLATSIPTANTRFNPR
jgi:hypothetical protein